MPPDASTPAPALPMLLSVRLAAQTLGWTEKALRHRIARGQVPSHRVGGSVFIRRADLLRLAGEGRGPSPGSR